MIFVPHTFKTFDYSRLRAFIQRHLNWVMLGGLSVIIVCLYAPAINAFFISDDFSYVTWLHHNVTALLAGQLWENWFIGALDGYLYFRPAGHVLMLLDSVIWDLNPFGFHLTNIVLHIIASFEVYLLTFVLVRKRLTASIAAIIFTILPIHAGAVSWVAARYDVLCGVYYFLGFVFYILYREKNKNRFLVFSLGAFVLALSAKEVAITFPGVLLGYEVIFSPWEASKVRDAAIRLVPFGLTLALYLGFRLFVMRTFGYPAVSLNPETTWGWFTQVMQNASDPFLVDLSQEGQWLFLSAIAIVVVLSRFRREILLGLAWITIAFVATISSGPSDRSFYVPSFGVSLFLTAVLVDVPNRLNRTLKLAALAAFVCLGIVYGTTLVWRNQAFWKAGNIAEAIPAEVKALHPTLPADARLVFVGVPDRVPEGPLVYLTGFPGFLNLLYPDQGFSVFKVQKFPIWLDDLTKTFFFQVNHRQVTERADLVSALEQRRQCANESYPAIQWDFSNDVQGWEPWNQLSDFTIRDAVLTANSDGTDPYMASPSIDIPSIAIGDVAITMRAQSSKPQLHGKIYWLATDQTDFYPGFQVPFAVQADGEYHTYRVDISHSNQLFIGDHILRLRLNPVDDSAEIAIKEIQVYAHCSTLQGESCACSQ